MEKAKKSKIKTDLFERGESIKEGDQIQADLMIIIIIIILIVLVVMEWW
jgi:hypothetical protein